MPNHVETLEIICDYMYSNNVDIVYMSETNNYSKNK